MDRIPRVVAVQTQPPYLLIVEFDDGQKRELDMKGELWGEVFEPLKDPAYFAQAQVCAELGTVVWPNGLDLAPESLYDPSLHKLRESETVELSGDRE